VSHEKPNTISVDDIRAQVNNDVAIKPYSSPHKVYIINEAEKMTPQAQNAILKTLEEPPEYAVIMLLTTNVNALLPTILSRCVVLNMKPVSDDKVREFLMKEMQIPDYKAEVCVAFARGNIGKAKALASSEDFEHVKSEALSLLKYIQDMEIYEIVTAIKKINDYKLDISDYLDIISIWYRDVLLFKATNDVNHLVFREEITALRKVAGRSSYEGIEEVIKALDTAKKRLDANVNFDLTMELLLLTIKEKG
jgi:DNA polymerase-3 subunit delta'